MPGLEKRREGRGEGTFRNWSFGTRGILTRGIGRSETGVEGLGVPKRLGVPKLEFRNEGEKGAEDQAGGRSETGVSERGQMEFRNEGKWSFGTRANWSFGTRGQTRGHGHTSNRWTDCVLRPTAPQGVARDWENGDPIRVTAASQERGLKVSPNCLLCFLRCKLYGSEKILGPILMASRRGQCPLWRRGKHGHHPAAFDGLQILVVCQMETDVVTR
jgi:hypothetical protein